MNEMRKIPQSLHEMLSWGMISHKVYKLVEHLPFDEAYHLIKTDYGTQTWSFVDQHFDEYLKENSIDILNYSKHDFMVMIIKACKGQVNPPVIAQYYDLKVAEYEN